MNGDELQVVAMTAVEAGEHVGELEAERAAAIASDVIGIDAYRRDLDRRDRDLAPLRSGGHDRAGHVPQRAGSSSTSPR